MISNNMKFAMTAAFAFGLAACSHTPPVADYPATANPVEEIQKLDADLHTAADNQAAVLSPKMYRKAGDAFGDAKQYQNKGKENKDVLKQIAISRAYLNETNKNMTGVQQTIPEVVKARHDAVLGGAMVQQKEELAATDSKLRDYTENVEDGKNKIDQADREEMKNSYLSIEVAAINRTRLAEARTLISQARKQGAERLTPKSLTAAEMKIKKVEDTITTDRHNVALLDQVTKDATDEARHALELTQLARQAKGESPEQIAMEMDAKKTQLNQRDSALNTATGEVKLRDTELNQKDQQLAVVAGTNDKLEKDKQFNDSFEKARKEFDPEQADVYRQGDNLLIRLKGLNFKSGRAELSGDSFPLLSKVKNVMTEVRTENVVVEGHTDAVGSKEANQKLSAARADAVAKYLVSENAVEQGKIKSEGYGFSKPLASNKSKEGRAQNRRVDVILTLSK